MKRVVVVGPGAAGKSTLAARLGQITRLPVIELNELFWRPGLAPTPQEEWAVIQRRLAAQESWIMDGDLGPYDVLDIRLQAADAIVFLDFSPLRCAWRAIRRSPRARRLLEVAALVSPPQPPGAPASDRRTRQ
jgi:adenylate kinase family enzyme